MRPRNAARRALISARLASPAALQAMQAAYQAPPDQRTPAQASIVGLIELARARRARNGTREN